MIPQGLKNQVQVKLNIVSCPPVTTVLIKRPDLKYQLGFSVQNGIVSSRAATFTPLQITRNYAFNVRAVGFPSTLL